MKVTKWNLEEAGAQSYPQRGEDGCGESGWMRGRGSGKGGLRPGSGEEKVQKEFLPSSDPENPVSGVPASS